MIMDSILPVVHIRQKGKENEGNKLARYSGFGVGIAIGLLARRRRSVVVAAE
jgi:hypothetical protein